MAWDVAEREDPEIASDLVSRACLRERISKRRRQPLILHADNGNAMRAATLEARLEELGVLRSFSRPRVSNDNPYSESLFRTVKYRPDYPSRPFVSREEACLWVAMFVEWYNHTHRHSGIRFVTPQQRHSGEALEICRHRARVYELARQQQPRRWTGRTRYPLLATTWGGLDQSPTTGRNQSQNGYIGYGRLIGGRGVIFPGSYHFARQRFMLHPALAGGPHGAQHRQHPPGRLAAVAAEGLQCRDVPVCHGLMVAGRSQHPPG